MGQVKKILVIQTAFIGDVILATPIIESITKSLPDCEIHFCLRKGNESLFNQHPHISKIHVWDKSRKYQSLISCIKDIRKENYDQVVCVQRFFNAGLLTVLSKAKSTIGFDKNPLSAFFTKKIKHVFSPSKHETERNTALLTSFCNKIDNKPKLHLNHLQPSKYPELKNTPFICIAPASVWKTKAYPIEKWVEFTNNIKDHTTYILGAPSDAVIANRIIEKTTNTNIVSLCGKFNLLESALIMQHAKMNFVNDSAPMHLASSVDAPVCAIYCSTIPEFGFGPLSKTSHIVQSKESLSCRPCGLHGKKECPKQHFKCGNTIDVNQLLELC